MAENVSEYCVLCSSGGIACFHPAVDPPFSPEDEEMLRKELERAAAEPPPAHEVGCVCGRQNGGIRLSEGRFMWP